MATLVFQSEFGPHIDIQVVEEDYTFGTSFYELDDDGTAWYTYDGVRTEILGFPPPPPPPIEPPPPAPEPAPGAPESIYGKKTIQSQVFNDKDLGDIHAGKAVRSKFNAWSLFKYLNQPGVTDPKDVTFNDYNKTITNDDIVNPTANRIIQYTDNLDSVSCSYSPRDFLSAEHFGQISNDYLVTLRRFPFPVPDDIINTKEFKAGTSKPADTVTQPDLARAVTWLSPALGNDLKEILKFGHKFNWKDEESKMQELQGGSAQNKRGALGAAIDGSSFMSAVESGVNGYSADAAARKDLEEMAMML